MNRLSFAVLMVISCLLATGADAGQTEPQVLVVGASSAPQVPLSLWYQKPATKWTDALAIGNGRLGAMVFGGINRERTLIQLGYGSQREYIS